MRPALALIAIAAIALALLWLSVRRSRIVDEPFSRPEDLGSQ